MTGTRRTRPPLRLCLRLVAALLLGGAGAALAAAPQPRPGTPDRTFSDDGVVLRDFGSELGWGNAKQLVAEADGSALVLTDRGSVGRVLPDGTFDQGFGEGGFLAVDPPEATAIAPAVDGRFLLAGRLRRRQGGPRRIVVSRYDGNGSRDRSFGSEGSIAFPDPEGFEGPEGAFVEADGKILLLGRVITTGLSAVESIRLRPDGSLDASYGRGGRARVRLPGSEYAEYVNDPLRDFALSAGKLTVGLSSLGGRDDLLLRIGADGRPDRTFGDDGIVATRALGGAVTGLAIEPDGRIVLSGEVGEVVRFMPDGTPDSGFGQGGIATFSGPGRFRTTAVGVQADGGIALAGVSGDESRTREAFLVARLTPAGAVDHGFGAGHGYAEAALDPDADNEAEALAVLPDGSLLMAGTSAVAAGGTFVPRLALARFAADGSPDPGLGGNGTVLTRPRVQASDSLAAAVALPHGAVAVAGTAGGRVLLARYLADGRPDRRFGASGFVTASTGPTIFGETATSLAAYPGERLLVGVASGSGGALLMYRRDGTPDRGFGDGGRVDVAGLDDVLDFSVGRGGAITAVGISYPQCEVSVVRLRPRGAPDRSFGGGDGIASLGRFPGACQRQPVRLLVRPDGRIVVGGMQAISFLRELTPDGTLVKGNGGRRRPYRDHPEKLNAMALDRRGRLLVAGKERSGELAVARYTPKGQLDPRFGRGGIFELQLDNATQALALRTLASGAMFVAAAIRECDVGPCEGTNPAVLRLTPSGKLDRRFGRGGVWTRRLGTSAAPLALALAPGALTLAGWANRPGTARDILIARLHR